MSVQKDLYFDVVSEEGAGGLYRLTNTGGGIEFYYHYSSADLESDKVYAAESRYNRFADFWKQFIRNNRWFCLHPLYIHPEQRAFIKQELNKVNWELVEDEKWRDMYRRQWNKVLGDPPVYYKPR
ncbi:MAG: hypothetical protein WKF97_09580 [Chitinophagaceae bacterium]